MQAPLCKNCVSGSLHEGEPQGSIQKVYGFDTYISHPPHTQDSHPSSTTPQHGAKVLLLIPDAFGWSTPNARLLADRYAARTSMPVYLPNFHEDTPLPQWLMTYPLDTLWTDWSSLGTIFKKPWMFGRLLWSFLPFLMVNGIGASHKRVRAFVDALRSDIGAEGVIGVMGFCWGGKHTFLLGSKDAVHPTLTATGDDGKEKGVPLINFAFSGHPGLVSVPEDAKNLAVPLSIAVGTNDEWLSLKDCETIKKILEEDKVKEGCAGELVLYKDALHGFACRSDQSNEVLKEAADKAEDQAVAWVLACLGRVGK